jgi:restriction system protein
LAIPGFEDWMLPLLKFTGGEKEHNLREAIQDISQQFGLSEADRMKLLPSGQRAVVDDRIGWARTYLRKAGLLSYPRRGYFKITTLGMDVLKKNPPRIDVKYLEQFPEFVAFKTLRRVEERLPEVEGLQYSKRTPDELLEAGYQTIKHNLAQELLGLVKNCAPDFFERIVVDLLERMGYGGPDAGEVTGRPGDEGVDGVIKEDKLGLDAIYIQAKRWEGTVGRPEIHKFVGALQGKRAKKGIFLTTSVFSEEAKEYASSIDPKVVLIDGEKLAEFMIDYDVGVSKTRTYDVKKVDQDYFSEE